MSREFYPLEHAKPLVSSPCDEHLDGCQGTIDEGCSAA
jgi:hypothetical protein